MNPLVAKLLAIGAAVLAAWGGVRYVQSLRADVAAAQQDASAARDQVTARDQTIARLAAIAQSNAELQQRLDRTRTQISAAQTRIEAATRRILNETPESRAWADTVLPADVARLQTSPDITGACDYLQRVPAGDAVRVACDGAANQP
ncbi:protein lysB [Burkholderia sp. B21-007]|uniref:protein lysB n=1 Tax=Burkholderia sp. B21-007 TaxID=2890407 RepID=UPI001E38E93C|nr:protein lysB [Burkholderia sp. B21-007]UEP31757.1 protein lysB [Burkholderia sp. B21-007]